VIKDEKEFQQKKQLLGKIKEIWETKCSDQRETHRS